MILYRRTKLAIDSFRNLKSNLLNNRGLLHTPNLSGKTTTAFPPSISSLIRKPNFHSHFQISPSRNYYVDRNQIYHFKPRGPEKWFKNPRNVLIVVVIGSGVGISIYFGNMETVPYTKRTHFVLLSSKMEKQLGEQEFERLKKSFQGKILPGIHPISVRVKLIAKDIIEALQRGVKQETVWSDPSYALERSRVQEDSAQEALRALMGDEDKVERDAWQKEEEVLDDKWVYQNRKKAREKGLQAATRHLDGLNWEVLVVDEPVVNAFCLPGGKIVVFTGLLNHFRTDDEIATIIGHEIGHAVARHSAEGITKNMWVGIIQIVLMQFVSMPDIVNAMSNLLLKLPFSRRMEIEADYIGLLLLASAGYNPRVAPKVYEKLGKIGGDSPLRDYLSTHPSGKRRAELLAQAKVMEEAVAIYNEVRAGRLVHDFL